MGSATASPVHGLRLGAANGRYGDACGKKGFLMTAEEAYVKVHGDIETVRDGDQTHQNIQTNLADIISGGELNETTAHVMHVAEFTDKHENGNGT